MSFGGGYNGGRTRMGTKVILNVYDLSPANDYLYPIGFGLHHSGVEILGSEYSFASGAGIFEETPKEAPGARFRESVELGVFDGGQSELKKILSDLRDDFGPEDYNLIRKNCNSFANALVWQLLGRQIPAHVNRLADVGVCCSCLLPKSLLEHSPVGDPNTPSRGSGGGMAYSSNRTSTTVKSFSGTGSRLGGSSEGSSTNGNSQGLVKGLFGSSSATNTSSTNREDDLTDRREKARMAAMARLERASKQNAGGDEAKDK